MSENQEGPILTVLGVWGQVFPSEVFILDVLTPNQPKFCEVSKVWRWFFFPSTLSNSCNGEFVPTFSITVSWKS